MFIIIKNFLYLCIFFTLNFMIYKILSLPIWIYYGGSVAIGFFFDNIIKFMDDMIKDLLNKIEVMLDEKSS